MVDSETAAALGQRSGYPDVPGEVAREVFGPALPKTPVPLKLKPNTPGPKMLVPSVPAPGSAEKLSPLAPEPVPVATPSVPRKSAL